MSKSDVFHLGLTKNDLQGATLAIVPGDPERVEKIAALMDKPVKLASHREFTSWRAELDGKPVIVCSTGIGGPSTSIAVEELAQLGVRTFLRIGTTGAIQPHINVGDVLVTTGSVRLDGASLHFAPMEFPARTHTPAHRPGHNIKNVSFVQHWRGSAQRLPLRGSWLRSEAEQTDAVEAVVFCLRFPKIETVPRPSSGPSGHLLQWGRL